MTTITVCTTCRCDKTNEDPIRDGTRLLNAVDQVVRENGHGGTITVRGIQCMSACKMACAAQISDDDRFTYVLAHLDPETAAADLVAFAHTHAEKDNGLVIKSARPEAIKDNVIARVPPAGFSDFPLTDDWTRLTDED